MNAEFEYYTKRNFANGESLEFFLNCSEYINTVLALFRISEKQWIAVQCNCKTIYLLEHIVYLALQLASVNLDGFSLSK